MIFYNQVDNNNYLLRQCITKRKSLNDFLDVQKQKKKTLLTCMAKITSTIDEIVDVDNVSALFDLLEELKVSLNLSEFNINKIIKLEKYLSELQSNISSNLAVPTSNYSVSKNDNDDSQYDLYEDIDKFNEKYSSIEKKVLENTNTINSFLQSFVEKSNFEIPNSKTSSFSLDTTD